MKFNIITEDDTFKKLCKYTYEELHAKIVEHWNLTNNDVYVHVLTEAGWSQDEYMTAWCERHITNT